MRIVALLLLTVGAHTAWSAAGDLDASFGNGGVVIHTLSIDWDQANTITVQPDGKIVVAGYAFAGADAFVARYDASGVLDPSFGAGGVATLVAPSQVNDLVVQPDGKIVVMGPFGTLAVVRLLADGSLDPSFGSGGFVDAGIDVGGDSAGGLVVQPDGRIVVAGSMSGTNFALARLEADGTPDLAFGTLGIAQTAIGTDETAEPFDLVFQPDGKLLVGGEASSNAFSDFALARFDDAGLIDPTFGTGGTVLRQVFGPDTDESIVAVALQADGKIVALGSPHGGPSAFVLARFTTGGALDASFGVSGMQIFGIAGSDFPEDLVVSPTGRLLIAGESQGIITVARVGSNGVVDGSFGVGGVARFDDPPLGACCSQLHAIALQPDGGIVAAGYSGPNFFVNHFDVAVIRVFGSECGNGIVEPGEDCDEVSPCCTGACGFAAAGAPCADDGVRCTRDVCDGGGACTHGGDVRAGCAATITGGGQVTLRNDVDDARDAVVWRWRKAPAISVGALGDPTLGTTYALCGFAPDGSLLFQLEAPAGGLCGGRPCWRTRGDVGFTYRDRDATPSGTTAVTAVAGPVGRPKFVVKGKGQLLTIPTLPLASPVRVQLQASNGFCVDTTFSAPSRDDAKGFRAKSD